MTIRMTARKVRAPMSEGRGCIEVTVTDEEEGEEAYIYVDVDDDGAAEIRESRFGGCPAWADEDEVIATARRFEGFDDEDDEDEDDDEDDEDDDEEEDEDDDEEEDEDDDDEDEEGGAR